MAFEKEVGRKKGELRQARGRGAARGTGDSADKRGGSARSPVVIVKEDGERKRGNGGACVHAERGGMVSGGEW